VCNAFKKNLSGEINDNNDKRNDDTKRITKNHHLTDTTQKQKTNR
jgi:hypothetical protein